MIKKLDINFIKSELKKIQNLFATGNFEKVIEKTQILLKKDPTQTPFYNFIGLAYKQLNNLEMAKSVFISGLKIRNDSPSILCNLGAVYRATEEFDKAEEVFSRALKLHPKNLSVLVNYANLKSDLNKIDEAIDLYDTGFKVNDSHETLLINYAGAFQIKGDFEKSKEILRQLHQKFPNNIVAHKMYSSINNYSENDAHQTLMIEKLKDEKLSFYEKATLCFALAKSYTDQKNHKASADYFIKGNENMFQTYKGANIDNQTNLFNKIKEEFKDYQFNVKKSKEKPRLIFIVGLPRSGTTLIHQIISSHSEIFGAGELPILKNVFLKNNQLDLKKDAMIKNLDIDKFSSAVLEKFKLYDNNSIILDKAPLNFMWIGHINLLFPDAKIIHCKRNLKDTALSIYKNMFDASALTWTYNQDHLLRFVELYQELINFWHQKIPNYIYDCSYEELVGNKDNETKKLIEFCNLEWEDNCIDHTKNKTGIKTVSISQAREPVYKSSVNLYETYTEYLPFLKKIKE